MSKLNFKITKKLPGKLGRAGELTTPHGVIETPAFVVVGTKATVKAVPTPTLKDIGVQVVLANTYHLFLQPGEQVIKNAGGLSKFMNWSGPTMTDSGGFQVFSLGVAYGEGGVSKFVNTPQNNELAETISNHKNKLAKIDEEGVTFSSHLDGSLRRLTPESSIAIQQAIGADIIFAFDECTSPLASYEYQVEAMNRTHRWAERSLQAHLGNLKNGGEQSLYGIVQGGRYQDLREASAKFLMSLSVDRQQFDGFGIGGSFEKKDLDTAVSWVTRVLPENKPRHLLGVGEVEDLFAGIENGIDTFDCVIPTRLARNGTLQTKAGRLNILNTKYQTDFSPIDPTCGCGTCKNYSRAYLAHLFRAKEMLAGTLASIHNIYFFVNLVKEIRQSILNDEFDEFRQKTLATYRKDLS